MKTKQESLKELKQNFKPATPGQAVEVGFFRPEDAPGVISTCYAVYGEGYPVDTYYIPEKLVEKNNRGIIHSVVAKNEDKEVVGHGALFQSSSPFEGMYEAGQYIIQKAYRGAGTSLEINRYVTELCPEKYKVAAMYGEPVTNHTITQKMGDIVGTIETALEIDMMPAQAYETEKTARGRVSTLLAFKIFKDRPHTIYPPLPYTDIIKADIGLLCLDREIAAPGKEKPVLSHSRITPEFYDFAGVGRLCVLDIGQDIDAAIQAFEKETQKRDYRVIQLFLPLDQPSIHDICIGLNAKGYFLGGYLPRWCDCDAILMQKVLPEPCFDGLKLYSEKAKQLLDFVKKDWERIGP